MSHHRIYLFRFAHIAQHNLMLLRSTGTIDTIIGYISTLLN